MTERAARIPAWALDALRCPITGDRLQFAGSNLVTGEGRLLARIEDGVVRFGLPDGDGSIGFYQEIGGARFHERSQVGYAMTTLDTSVYHGYLAELRPASAAATIVDVGGGDGRNALPWLEWGYRHVVVIDPAGEALRRFRSRIAERQPDWLARVLLIEADARHLPIAPGWADRIFAIESLAYLNDDYRLGLRACVRAMADGGRLLVADRDYEGALLVRLFYEGGVAGMIEQAAGRSVWDGRDGRVVGSRCFTAEEFAAEVTACGLRIATHRGISAMSLLLGYLRSTGRITGDDDRRLPEVHRLLSTLGRQGLMRRSHVIVADRA